MPTPRYDQESPRPKDLIPSLLWCPEDNIEQVVALLNSELGNGITTTDRSGAARREWKIASSDEHLEVLFGREHTTKRWYVQILTIQTNDPKAKLLITALERAGCVLSQ